MKTDLVSLLDVATAARQIQRYCLSTDRIQFEQDDEKQAAVLYRIGVIGEAVKRISPDFRVTFGAATLFDTQMFLGSKWQA